MSAGALFLLVQVQGRKFSRSVDKTLSVLALTPSGTPPPLPSPFQCSHIFHLDISSKRCTRVQRTCRVLELLEPSLSLYDSHGMTICFNLSFRVNLMIEYVGISISSYCLTPSIVPWYPTNKEYWDGAVHWYFHKNSIYCFNPGIVPWYSNTQRMVRRCSKKWYIDTFIRNHHVLFCK